MTRSGLFGLLRCAFLSALGALAVVTAPAAAAPTGVKPPPTPVENKPRVLVVPTAYPTIQAAVDAARRGDQVAVRPGVYREQVSVGKDLTITGSGTRATTIRAPNTLAPGDDGGSFIVQIHDGASVAMSQLTVSGPGAGTCDNGSLGSGIRVLGGGHLGLSFARVTKIEDTPVAPCVHSDTAILVGDFPVGVGSATISDSEISDYQGAGIVVLNEGSVATIARNVVTGQGRISTDGIEFVLGSIGRITDNVVRGNACRVPDPDCGPDFFSETQHVGINAGGPGTVITRNQVDGNQIGIYALGSAEIHDNVMTNNDYFGMALQDGSFNPRRDRVTGGFGGVAVIAAFADAEAALDHMRITRTSGTPVQDFECCGFTATSTGGL